MKKFLCAFLTVTMLVTMICPVMAAPTAISADKAQAIALKNAVEGRISSIGHSQRVSIWNNARVQLTTDDGINNIIRALNGDSVIGLGTELNNVIDRLEGRPEKDALIFALNVYDAVPTAKRTASINAFVNRTPVTGVETAASTLYGKYVGSNAQSVFTAHSLNADNMLQLLTAFKGQFKMTNGADGKFVLSSFNEAFATALASNINVSSINGVTVSASPNAKAEGFDIIKGIIAGINTFDSVDIENLKVVLAHADIDLYGAGLTVAARPTEGTTGTITGGFGGGSAYLPDKEETEEPEEPVEPEKPIIDDTAFEISTPVVEEDAPTFTDTVDRWSEDYVRNLASRGIILGDDDGNFRPDAGVTRQEVAVMLVRGLGLEEEAAKYAEKGTGCSDDADIADWAAGAINLLVEMGIFKGYDDGEFKPNKGILRQELITIAMRYADNTKKSMEINYTDSHEIHDYARDYVAHASELGIIGGYPDGSFAPLNGITRGEAAKVLYGIFSYYEFLNK